VDTLSEVTHESGHSFDPQETISDKCLFPEIYENETPKKVDFLSSKGWYQFTSGFIVGGFGGASVGYVLLRFFHL